MLFIREVLQGKPTAQLARELGSSRTTATDPRHRPPVGAAIGRQTARGVHKQYLSGYVAIHEFSVNHKAISPDFVSALVRTRLF